MPSICEYERRGIAVLPWLFPVLKAQILGKDLAEVVVKGQGVEWVPKSWSVIGSGLDVKFYEQKVVFEFDDPVVRSIEVFFKTAPDETCPDPTNQIRITGTHAVGVSCGKPEGLDIVALRTLSHQWEQKPPVLNLDPWVTH